ncbi:MAG: hypothetical protein AAB425_10445, partial [Bdellovibrionota bacterium]
MRSLSKVRGKIAVSALIIIIFLVTGVACMRGTRTRVSKSTGVLARMEKALLPESVLGRVPASDPSPVPLLERCLADTIGRASAIDTEIGYYESKFSAKTPTGFWGNVDLAKIPIGQSQFLNRHGNATLPATAKALACTDARCVLKSLYGLGRELDADLHYLFFLRTGYGLGATRNVPDVAPVAGMSDSGYQFSHKELKGFWLLSKALNREFLNLASLQNLYRLPPTFHLPKYGENVCGLATGTATEGHIRLMDGCLSLSEPIAPDRDFFFVGTTHEIVHRLDNVLVKNVGGFSLSQEWLKL